VPVITMRQPDAGALGAAVLAGVGVGWWPDVAAACAEMVAEAAVFEPRDANRALYDERYGLYLDSYAALVPTFDRLSRAA
jgi:sugar (pentulose or hexulose) kinase